VNAADAKKPLTADLRYDLPRWLLFGVVAGRNETSATPAPEQQLGSPEQQLSDIVADINKTTPHQANSVSRLDSAEVAPGLVLQYNYTLTTVSGDEDEMAAVRLKLQSIREGALQYFCT
jgi:hypothetical protein